MKKITKIILLIILATLVVARYVPLGSYYTNKTLYPIKVPRLSILKRECCMSVASFSSLKSKYTLKKELKKIMATFEEKKCDDKTYYYDKEKNITIYDYGIESGFVLSNFYISYTLGNQGCNSQEIDYEKINDFYSDLLTDGITNVIELDNNYTYNEAINDKAVVVRNKEISNSDILDTFLEDINANKKSFLRIVDITVEGGLIITDIKYEDDNVVVISDNTRDSFTEDRIDINTYKNIEEIIDTSKYPAVSSLIVYDEDINNARVLLERNRIVD